MPVSLSHIRAELMPGLWAVRGAYAEMPVQWEKLFAAPEIVSPPIMLGPSAIVALGVAAAIVKNPEVSRRGLFTFGASA